ncbi:unannotated protein [freshwater metagenome]|uniref:Unannotated protein n=1 Tax=freshwater metagenome TaxID=449393 RepID=A0A6J6YV52_9ZZZZ
MGTPSVKNTMVLGTRPVVVASDWRRVRNSASSQFVPPLGLDDHVPFRVSIAVSRVETSLSLVMSQYFCQDVVPSTCE